MYTIKRRKRQHGWFYMALLFVGVSLFGLGIQEPNEISLFKLLFYFGALVLILYYGGKEQWAPTKE